jgi:hypothetical protein
LSVSLLYCCGQLFYLCLRSIKGGTGDCR